MHKTLGSCSAAVLALALASPASAQYLAMYDFFTGEIIFPQLNGELGLKMTALEPGALVGGQATDLGGAASGMFGVVNDQADALGFIEWGNLLGMTTDGSVSAGNVAQPGLDLMPPTDLVPYYVVPAISFEVARSASEIERGYVVAYPAEPSATVLAALAVLGLTAARWRRS